MQASRADESYRLLELPAVQPPQQEQFPVQPPEATDFLRLTLIERTTAPTIKSRIAPTRRVPQFCISQVNISVPPIRVFI